MKEEMKELVEQLVRDKLELEAQLRVVAAVADRLGGHLIQLTESAHVYIDDESEMPTVRITREPEGVNVSAV